MCISRSSCVTVGDIAPHGGSRSPACASAALCPRTPGVSGWYRRPAIQTQSRRVHRKTGFSTGVRAHSAQCGHHPCHAHHLFKCITACSAGERQPYTCRNALNNLLITVDGDSLMETGMSHLQPVEAGVSCRQCYQRCRACAGSARLLLALYGSCGWRSLQSVACSPLDLPGMLVTWHCLGPLSLLGY